MIPVKDAHQIDGPVVDRYCSQGQSRRHCVLEGLQGPPKGMIGGGRIDQVGDHDLPLVGDIVNLESRGGDDTKVGAYSANGPKKVRILPRCCCD